MITTTTILRNLLEDMEAKAVAQFRAQHDLHLIAERLRIYQQALFHCERLVASQQHDLAVKNLRTVLNSLTDENSGTADNGLSISMDGRHC